MAERIDSDKIEDIVGAKRHPINHIARAVSDEEYVYILHSQQCLDREINGERFLLDCPYTKALNRGIDVAEWAEDVPLRVMVAWGRLVPYDALTDGRPR